MRIEKKYTLEAEMLNQVRDSLLGSKLGFSKAYNDRYVNSVYLDSFNFENYQENLAGVSLRSKARARWYSSSPFSGLSASTKLSFEIKLRRNIFGDKLISYVGLPENLNSLSSIELIQLFREQLPRDFLPHIDHCNELSLGVSYLREYYEDFNRNLRVTIDSNIKFFRPEYQNTLDHSSIKTLSMDYSILECKFAPDFASIAEDTISALGGVSAGRHSKYTVGLLLTNT
jgi:hypothetical protein